MNAAVESAPVMLQTPDRIKKLQERVSASRLTLFSQCRLKFWFRYVLRVPKAKTPSLHVGSTIHSTLKAWNKARWKNAPLNTTQLHQEFARAWVEDQEAEPVAWENDDTQQMGTAWRLLETYIRECPINPAQKPEAVEVSVETDLSSLGLPTLVGVIDLVQQGRVVDYKTSSTTPNPATVAHLHEVQASCYSILYRDATGRTEQGIELHHLVKLKTPKIVVTPLPPMSEQQETRLFRIMESYQHGLDVRDFVPSPGMGCLSCEFFNECRQWS
jgi:CRISPR/Cas system-associated exonuclease Cas4 (RecB family)